MSQSETLKDLARISRQRFSLDRLPEVIAEINASSDRSVAIVLGSLVEDALRTAIMRQMNHLSNQETNELFDTNGPLSTFSSKIQICYGIKIIDRAQKYDTHHVQKIRNAFAHGFLGLSFDLEQIRNACKLLKTPARWPEHESWSPRQQFIFTCAVLWLKLGDFADGFVYNRDKGLQLFTRDPS